MDSAHRLLAQLYTDKASIERVIGDAGLEPSHFNLNAKPIDVWKKIVVEAESINRLGAILGIARDDFEGNTEIEQLYNRFWQKDVASVRRETGAGIFANGGVHDRVGEVYLIREVNELRQVTEQLVNDISSMRQALRPRRARTYMLLALFIAVPAVALLSNSGFREWWNLGDFAAIGWAIVFGYGPLFVYLLTDPQQYREW